MRVEVAARCGKVTQVFELDVDPTELDKLYDVTTTDAGIETLLCSFLASGGLDMLRKMAGHNKARRIRYECPYPGGYIGPERCYTSFENSELHATMRSIKNVLMQLDVAQEERGFKVLRDLLDKYETEHGLL